MTIKKMSNIIVLLLVIFVIKTEQCPHSHEKEGEHGHGHAARSNVGKLKPRCEISIKYASFITYFWKKYLFCLIL